MCVCLPVGVNCVDTHPMTGAGGRKGQCVVVVTARPVKCLQMQ